VIAMEIVIMAPDGRRVIQHPASGLPRTPLPRRWVNRGAGPGIRSIRGASDEPQDEDDQENYHQHRYHRVNNPTAHVLTS
jgi:hypothetical protein